MLSKGCGVLGEGVEDVPVLLAGCGRDGTENGKGLGFGHGAKRAGDFLLDLHHAEVLLGLIIRKRHVGIGEEVQDVVFAGLQAQE